MQKYYRIFPGPQAIYADDCFKNNYIGVGFLPNIDITSDTSENWAMFNKKYIPEWLKENPNKSKVAAGLACGMLWTTARGLSIGDIIICPTGQRSYYVGEISGDYMFVPDTPLPHRRPIKWYAGAINRDDMSAPLRNSLGSIATLADVSKYEDEIRSLISGKQTNTLICQDSSVEDPYVFALENHLEDFLVQNWKNIELGKQYDIYEEDGEVIGRQYRTDCGIIDILAISKDKKHFLVVELKRGRTSDTVVGQIQRYMGYVKETMLEPGQDVRGIIIALEDDTNIKYALSVARNIEFYRYSINFSLFKAQ